MLYPELDAMMTVRPSVYPTEVKDRGQVDPNPWTLQALEVNPKARYVRGTPKSAYVDIHRVEGPTLDPGRVLNNPSRVMAPVLIDSNQPQTFDIPHYIIDWAPNPIIQRTYGQTTLAPDDMRHTTPKQLLGYSSDALSQQELADKATLAVRRAMYGR